MPNGGGPAPIAKAMNSTMTRYRTGNQADANTATQAKFLANGKLTWEFSFLDVRSNGEFEITGSSTRTSENRRRRPNETERCPRKRGRQSRHGADLYIVSKCPSRAFRQLYYTTCKKEAQRCCAGVEIPFRGNLAEGVGSRFREVYFPRLERVGGNDSRPVRVHYCAARGPFPAARCSKSGFSDHFNPNAARICRAAASGGNSPD